MSDLPLHPAIVHIAIGLGFVIPLIALGLTAALWRDALPKRAWAIVVALQALVFAATLLALRTGEAEEERVERVVAESVIETHEDAGKTFAFGAGVTLVLAALGLALKKPAATRALTAATTVAAIVVAGLTYRTGHSGGSLVYRHGAAAVYVTPSAGSSAERAEALPGEDAIAPATGEDDEDDEEDTD